MVFVLVLGLMGWIALFGLLGAYIGSSKGRSDGFWWGAGLGPVGLIIEALLPEDRTRDSKRCPRCAEWIKLEASVCRYCGAPSVPTPPSAKDTASGRFVHVVRAQHLQPGHVLVLASTGSEIGTVASTSRDGASIMVSMADGSTMTFDCRAKIPVGFELKR